MDSLILALILLLLDIIYIPILMQTSQAILMSDGQFLYIMYTVGLISFLRTVRNKGQLQKLSIEAKYRAMVNGVTDITWVHHILGEFHKHILLSTLLCDNQSTINIALNSILHSHTKYIKIDQYCMQQKIEDKEFTPTYICMHEQLAHIFIKRLKG